MLVKFSRLHVRVCIDRTWINFGFSMVFKPLRIFIDFFGWECLITWEPKNLTQKIIEQKTAAEYKESLN